MDRDASVETYLVEVPLVQICFTSDRPIERTAACGGAGRGFPDASLPTGVGMPQTIVAMARRDVRYSA